MGKPSEKRGQISVFIIIGVILVILVGFIFFYLSLKSPQVTSDQLSSKNQHIIGFIEGCVDQKAKQSLFFFGFIGGDTLINGVDPFKRLYYEYDEYYKIPYHYYGGINIDFNVEQILSEFMNQQLPYCINNFENLQDDAEFVIPNLDTEVFIKDESVVFNAKYPIKVIRPDKETRLGPVFTATIPLRLKQMTQIGERIVYEAKKDPSIIHWSYISEINSQDYNMTAYTGNDNTIIYRIIDNKNRIDNNEFVYQFCVKV